MGELTPLQCFLAGLAVAGAGVGVLLFFAKRSVAERRLRDEQIAAEPQLTPPELPPGLVPQPVEAYLGRGRRPVAVAGVVENGLVRPLDPGVTLTERARVIIVTTEGTGAG